jgi:hypothetical protein
MEKVSTYLELSGTSATGSEIEKSVTGNAKALRTAIETLVEDGYVTRRQGAKRAVLHTSIRPYREADEPPPFSSSSVRPQFVLNLKSEEFVHSSSPYGGTKTICFVPETDSSSSNPLSEGDPIPEYEHPLPDDSVYDPETDQPSPNGHTADWTI